MNRDIGRIFTAPPRTEPLLCVGVDTFGDGSLAIVVRRRDHKPMFRHGDMVRYAAYARSELRPLSPTEG